MSWTFTVSATRPHTHCKTGCGTNLPSSNNCSCLAVLQTAEVDQVYRCLLWKLVLRSSFVLMSSFVVPSRIRFRPVTTEGSVITMFTFAVDVVNTGFLKPQCQRHRAIMVTAVLVSRAWLLLLSKQQDKWRCPPEGTVLV